MAASAACLVPAGPVRANPALQQPPAVESLGPASLAFPVVGAALSGDVLWVSSRNLVPARLAGVDLARRVAVGDVAVPVGAGAWGLAADPNGSWLLAGMFGARGQPNVHRLDLATLELEALAALDADYIWDLAVAPDGFAYAVTAPDHAYELAPDGTVRDLGVIEAGRETLRAVAASARHVFLGGARDGRAQLRVLSRTDGGVHDVTPAEIAQDYLVYEVTVEDDVVAGGTRGPGAVAPALFAADLTEATSAEGWRTRRFPEASVIDAVRPARSDVLATLRTSGAWVRWDPSTGGATTLATPVPHAEHRGIFRWRDRVVGAAADGSVALIDLRSGTVEVLDLVGDGLLPAGPERAQSLAGWSGTAWAAGSFSLTEHGSGGRQRRFTPGEAKALAVVGGTLYLALYPGAELWVLPPSAAEARELAQLPVEQNRPFDLVHAPLTDELIVTTAADRLGGGALHHVQRATGAHATFVDPLPSRQHPAALAADGDVVYVGGSGANPALLCWDLAARAPRWVLDELAPGGGTVTGLSVLDGTVVALTSDGHLVHVDPQGPTVSARAAVPGFVAPGGRLAVLGDAVWGVDADGLVRIDPHARSAERALTGLAPQAWGFPPLAADHPRGVLLALRGTELVAIRP